MTPDRYKEAREKRKTNRRKFLARKANERTDLIHEVARVCYDAWDVWDFGEPNYGVQLAYLFAAIASYPSDFEFDGRYSDGTESGFVIALRELFKPDHDVWLFIKC